MGRIRTIKPEIFLHSDLYDAEVESKLPLRTAWMGIFTCCDRAGRFKWRPRELKLQVLPYDNLDFSRVLDALLTRGFIVKYRVGDEWFGCIPSWEKHQIINNRESESTIPDVSQNQQLDASSTREPRDGDADAGEGKGKEGKGIGKEGKALVERVFVFYCEKVGRDPKKYTLTAERQAKALSRIAERLKVHKGELEPVKAELAQAIRNLAASDYHREGGYLDWTEQIFRSEEEFQKRLNWKKPEAPNGTNRGNTLGNRKADDAQNALARVHQRIIDRAQAAESNAGLAGDVAEPGGGDGRDSLGLVLDGTR